MIGEANKSHARCNAPGDCCLKAIQGDQMARRRTVLLSAAAISLPAVGQEKIWRLSWLSPADGPGPNHNAFVQQLKRLGYEEGRNLRIDCGCWRPRSSKPRNRRPRVHERVKTNVVSYVASCDAFVQCKSVSSRLADLRELLRGMPASGRRSERWCGSGAS